MNRTRKIVVFGSLLPLLATAACLEVPSARQFAENGKRRPESLVGVGRAIVPGQTRIEDALIAIDRQTFGEPPRVPAHDDHVQGFHSLFSWLRISSDARRFAIDYRLRTGWYIGSFDADFIGPTLGDRTLVLDCDQTGVVRQIRSEETLGETYVNSSEAGELPPIDRLFAILNDEARVKLRAAHVLPSDDELRGLAESQAFQRMHGWYDPQAAPPSIDVSATWPTANRHTD